jgi:alpha-tubulin suppressor-like RCC1 family protein
MKRLNPLLIACVVLLVLGFVLVLARRGREASFKIGGSLPSGRVQPQICVAWDMAVMLAPDGTLWIWGGSQSRLPHVVKPPKSEIPVKLDQDSDWAQVDCGSSSIIVALKQDGTAWSWGMTTDGQMTNPPVRPNKLGSDDDWAAVSGGAGHALLLKRDGSLWAMGQNDRGQVGIGTKGATREPLQRVGDGNDWAIIEAGSFSSFGIKQDGTLWAWGFSTPATGTDMLVPTQIDAGTNWVEISAGDYHLLARKDDGSIWLWGPNAHVTVPAVTSVPVGKLVPVVIGEMEGEWTELLSGQNSFMAQRADGTWWACGSQRYGQLGFGNRRNIDEPEPMAFEIDPWALGLGSQTMVLLARDGTLWSWGVRLGAPKGPETLESRVERLLRRLRGSRNVGRSFQPEYDLRPRKIWELPAEVNGGLSPTNQSEAK